jgi:hypothetical protein
LSRLSYVWDYDIDEAQFQALLDGEITIGRLDANWAAIRLIEYAPYPEIVRRLGFRRLLKGWPEWRGRIRSKSRQRGLDFLAAWLPANHSELL